MNRKPNESSNSQGQGSEKVIEDQPLTDKPGREKGRKNSEKQGKPGEKDGTVLGEIND